MQPYFFPYIGYWQLIYAADRFVIYDDVNYIKSGWINRNRILINGTASYITIPLNQASANKNICEIDLQSSINWQEKLIKTIEMTYRKAPFFMEVFPVIEKIIRYESDNLADFLAHQLQTLALFMGIKTEFVVTSRSYENDDLSSQERILDICRREGATTYVNAQGGQALYNTETFRDAGVDLRFIVMRSVPYKQRSIGFTPYLSIVDALMENGPLGIKQHLDCFELIQNGTTENLAVLPKINE